MNFFLKFLYHLILEINPDSVLGEVVDRARQSMRQSFRRKPGQNPVAEMAKVRDHRAQTHLNPLLPSSLPPIPSSETKELLEDEDQEMDQESKNLSTKIQDSELKGLNQT